jgi:hypothetical protein
MRNNIVANNDHLIEDNDELSQTRLNLGLEDNFAPDIGVQKGNSKYGGVNIGPINRSRTEKNEYEPKI